MNEAREKLSATQCKGRDTQSKNISNNDYNKIASEVQDVSLSMHILIVSADGRMFSQFGSGCTIGTYKEMYAGEFRAYQIFMIAPGDPPDDFGNTGTILGRYKSATKAMGIVREIREAILNGENVYELPEEDD